MGRRSQIAQRNKNWEAINILIVPICIVWFIIVSMVNTDGLHSMIFGEKAAPLESGGLTDSNTGISFAAQESFSIARPPMTLLGVGTRKKAILNVYSLGLYGSKPVTKQFLAHDESTQSKAAKCQAIQDTKNPRAMQLKFHMSIRPKKIAEAVSGVKGVAKKVREEFHAMLLEGLKSNGGKLQKGESMTFEWKGTDVLQVTARGEKLGTMKDQALAQAVLGLYVGPKSVSPSLLSNLNCL